MNDDRAKFEALGFTPLNILGRLKTEDDLERYVAERIALASAQAASAKFEALTDERILMIGRRALDKCHGADAQHIYLAREVERVLASAQAASAEPVARKPILTPGKKERFDVAPDGSFIDDDDFTFDARLMVSGDFGDDVSRLAYAREIADLLNTTPAPAVAPAAVTDEQTPEFRERVLEIAHQLRSGDPNRPTQREAAALIEDWYLATRTPEPQAEPNAGTDAETLRCALINNLPLSVDQRSALYALLPAEPQPDSRGQAREGWKLVPVEPTPEMLDKGGMEHAMNFQRVQTSDDAAGHVYRAMLAASPTPDEQRAQAAQENEEGLLPCPICGSDEVSRSMGEKGDGTPWPYIECIECGACTEPDVWNRRAALAGRQQL